jgi:VRR-NUC domain
MQPERRLVQKIQAYLEEQGARPFKIHGDDSYQEAGIPDLLVCLRGRFVGLEVKLPGNSPSPLQEKVLREIKRSGGIAEVVTSVDQVRTLIAKMEKKR